MELSTKITSHFLCNKNWIWVSQIWPLAKWYQVILFALGICDLNGHFHPVKKMHLSKVHAGNCPFQKCREDSRRIHQVFRSLELAQVLFRWLLWLQSLPGILNDAFPQQFWSYTCMVSILTCVGRCFWTINRDWNTLISRHKNCTNFCDQKTITLNC